MIMEITKKIPVPTLALQGKWDSINIGVGVIAALGNPSHICLLRNMKEKSLAVIACDGKDTRLFSVSSRRTPCGRTPLTESGLAAFPHPALCETNRSHLSIIYTDIYSGSYQWIAVIYHIQKFYPVVAFLLTPPI